MNERILDKIRKVLTLAENNPSEQEAQSALLLAQRLMVENGIAMADLKVSNKVDEEVVSEAAHDMTKTPWWYYELARVLADNFRCKFFATTQGKGYSQVTFLGLKSDVETIKTLFNFATLTLKYQTQRLRTKYRKEGKPTDGIANDYIAGFLKGLKDKFAEQVSQNGWGLVLVTGAAVIKSFEAMNLGSKAAPKHKRAHDSDAYGLGIERGRAFNSPTGHITD